MTQEPKGIRAPLQPAARQRAWPDILGSDVFNKEKREKNKAVKAVLKQEIKPRRTFDQKVAAKARRLDRDAVVEARHAVVAQRLRDIHAGVAEQKNVAR